MLGDSEFASSVDAVREITSEGATHIEIVTRESRRGTYPIVHHDGTAQVHTFAPQNEYMTLGSILDPGTSDAIFRRMLRRTS